ncbi:hypothetical protein [Methylobacterium nonmethylotrophicum]|uniref:Uncharacterized protein n=1 Tax=Methylobacterium nonmethylotrophicum TaxID=1141884 RepID=A0A4Z0NIU1_9HYPH|nr:hypothetical protein [Methylobacterium nonmethylotrophicum]TGD95717.1 hypothetical protein EU555_26940 [Methylobacterium nonmethylotrophicum]
MRQMPFALAALIAAAEAAVAQAPAPQPQILDCADFSRKTEEAYFVKRFGRENVVTAKLDGAEGETIPGTVVYPKDPSRRLEITWSDAKRRKGLTGITVRGQSEWLVRTPGKARETLRLRDSLEAVQEANERPFQISGFGWDYGGYATGWKGGRLDAMPAGCGLSVRFNPDPTVRGKAADRASGEKDFSSADPAMRAAKPFVSSLTLGWPE